MALVKSSPSNAYQAPAAADPEAAATTGTDGNNATPVQESQQRRGDDFGRKPSSPDTYVKLRFSDTPEMPETWFKLRVRSDGVHAFEPTSDVHPVVLLMNKGDSKLRMYHKDDAGNFDGVGNQRLEGVLAEIQVRKRRDSDPNRPSYFLVGTYFPEEDRGERELKGNMVGAKGQELMHELSQAAYQEWKASRPVRESDNRTPAHASAAPSPAPAPAPMELVAGEELDFGV